MDDPGRAREYSRIKEILTVTGIGLGLATSAGFVLSGAARGLGRKLIKRRRPSLQERLGYEATLAAGSWLAGLPLAFYGGYVIEKRFGLSRQTPTDWGRDQLKGQAIGLAIGLPMIEALGWTMRTYPRHWWLIVSGATVPITAVFAQLFPVLIAPRFNRYEPLQDEELAERLRELAAKTGIEVAEVLQMDMSRRTTKANAFFAGLGNTKRIVLADTMLEEFTPEEIEAVVAHEIGHQVYRDIWRFVGLSAVMTLVTAATVDRLGKRILRSDGRRLVGTRDIGDVRALPLLGALVSVIGTLLTPLQLAYTRQIERRTDAYALALTHNPTAYAGAMRKLADMNLADPNPPRLVVLLLHSHPPIAERIAMAEQAPESRAQDSP